MSENMGRKGFWPDEWELKLYCILKPALSLASLCLSSISKLPVKIQIVDIFSFADHTVPVSTTQSATAV